VSTYYTPTDQQSPRTSPSKSWPPIAFDLSKSETIVMIREAEELVPVMQAASDELVLEDTKF